MKKVILIAAVCLFAAAGLAQAEVGELHGVIDLTFQSKYIWRGFDVYGDKSAIQPSNDLDLFGSGFGLNITGHRANSPVMKMANDGTTWCTMVTNSLKTRSMRPTGEWLMSSIITRTAAVTPRAAQTCRN